MPIPSFRHLDDESLMIDPEIEKGADRLLATLRMVYREIGPGLREPIYQEAVSIALTEAAIDFIERPRLPILFRGRMLRRCAEPDFLVGQHIVLELKAVEQFHPAHHAQLLTYLKVTQRPLGFLMNFCAPRLGDGIKRKVLSP